MRFSLGETAPLSSFHFPPIGRRPLHPLCAFNNSIGSSVKNREREQIWNARLVSPWSIVPLCRALLEGSSKTAGGMIDQGQIEIGPILDLSPRQDWADLLPFISKTCASPMLSKNGRHRASFQIRPVIACHRAHPLSPLLGCTLLAFLREFAGGREEEEARCTS